MTSKRSANSNPEAQSTDAPDHDRDIQLQRSSADVLADLERSLQPFLWKTSSSGLPKIRRHVKLQETQRLVNLLEPFQELPQLLDPHLSKLVPVLADAFLAYLQTPPPKNQRPVDSKLLAPLSSSICRLLYTFCKIRGEKVIVRFLSTETRYLELLLSAIEAGGESASSDTKAWEERYIILLWLSQLLLAPFDLASISSADTVDINQATVPHLEWPASVPAVALRVIPLAIHYLSSSGKERNAAKILLVRIAMRRDMQELGILRSLVHWAIHELRPSDVVQPAYHYIGIISFISGVLISSIDTTDMDTLLPSIFSLAQGFSGEENAVFQSIRSSAVARKAIVKVLRSIAVLSLSKASEDSEERIEFVISSLLEYLSDSAIPVRLAASKALSMITLKLDPDMAAQVVDAVLESLEAGVKWLEPPVDNRGFQLTNANPREWHGLILTLSHLLYRHSVPSSSLNNILTYLLVGLSFEQRSTSGASVGANVRDASCFGIWALARRYTTAELESVDINTACLSGAVLPESQPHVSALQRLATELVVSGCLDPAGNIRRGASAALQELIGRHPDTIEEGIQVVQVVDYHAVALRSRAIQETAPQSAQLSSHYYEAIKLALLGWRGAQDNDASVRRVIANGFGKVIETRRTTSDGSLGLMVEIEGLLRVLFARLQSLPSREVGQAHGLHLCLANLVGCLKLDLNPAQMMQVIKNDKDAEGTIPVTSAQSIVRDLSSRDIFKLSALGPLFESGDQKSPELLAESASLLMLAMYPVLRADIVFRWFEARYGLQQNLPALEDISPTDDVVLQLLNVPPLVICSPNDDVPEYLQLMEWVYSGVYDGGESLATRGICLPDPGSCASMTKLIDQLLSLKGSASVEAVSDAAAGILLLKSSAERSSLVNEWIELAAPNDFQNQGSSYLTALLKSYPAAVKSPRNYNEPGEQNEALCVIHGRWIKAQLSHDIDTCATILSALANSMAMTGDPDSVVHIIKEGLDDYTTDSRGDIGSHLRIEAAKAAAAFYTVIPFAADEYHDLFGRVLRVAVDKIDKVRDEGQKAIAAAFHEEIPVSSLQANFAYFLEMAPLDQFAPLRLDEEWMITLFEGFVVSADAGSEDIVRASRAALVEYTIPGNIDLVCNTVFSVMQKNSNNDRVLVSAMEIMGFLFDMGIAHKSSLDLKTLFMFIQNAHYKTQNVRKLEAAVKLYGALSEVYPPAVTKLTGMLLHAYPTIRNLVAEEIFVAKGVGKSVNWGKARKVDVEKVRSHLAVA